MIWKFLHDCHDCKHYDNCKKEKRFSTDCKEFEFAQGGENMKELCEVRNNMDYCSKCGFCHKGDDAEEE